MRSLILTLLVLAAPAFAQAAGSKTQKKPSAAMLNDRDEDEPAPHEGKKKKALNDALCGDEDRALANALAFAFEQAPEEIRVLAIEDLALLGDSRAVDPLASLILDANPNVAAAATRAVGMFTTPRATQVLENVVRHPRLALNVKQEALRALPFHRRQRARDFLAFVARSSAFPVQLQRSAQDALVAFDLSQPPLIQSNSGANR